MYLYKSKSKENKYTIVMKYDNIWTFNNSPTNKIKIDYLKRIKYVVNNGGGYAREAESARARRGHEPD